MLPQRSLFEINYCLTDIGGRALESRKQTSKRKETTEKERISIYALNSPSFSLKIIVYTIVMIQGLSHLVKLNKSVT